MVFNSKFSKLSYSNNYNRRYGHWHLSPPAPSYSIHLWPYTNNNSGYYSCTLGLKNQSFEDKLFKTYGRLVNRVCLTDLTIIDSQSRHNCTYPFTNTICFVPSRSVFLPQNENTSDYDASMISLMHPSPISNLTTTEKVDTDINNTKNSH